MHVCLKRIGKSKQGKVSEAFSGGYYGYRQFTAETGMTALSYLFSQG